MGSRAQKGIEVSHTMHDYGDCGTPLFEIPASGGDLLPMDVIRQLNVEHHHEQKFSLSRWVMGKHTSTPDRTEKPIPMTELIRERTFTPMFGPSSSSDTVYNPVDEADTEESAWQLCSESDDEIQLTGYEFFGV
ncbi:hypothetical protein V9T40_010413 [Parthenolecanium corni]|uniref:Uncharacterized protein n=1 Tax=Parthenolecanium corni TaxID=536013 RepID=A0AAN9TAG5_9HEMI